MQLPPAAYSCCACFVAGEPGGGGICFVAWADAPPVGAWKCRSGAGAGCRVCRRLAAVGGDTPPKATRKWNLGGGRFFVEPPSYLRSNSTNSSTLKPASLMSFLRVPLSSSLVFWHRKRNHVACFYHYDMAAGLPCHEPTIFRKSLNCFHARYPGQSCHQTATSIIRAPPLTSMRSFRTSRQPYIASFMFSSASSTVFPCDTQPGMDGHSTTYQPSSPSLITTLYFISRSHPLKMCF